MTPLYNPDKPPLRSAKRSIDVDMSPTAIDRRMREMFELWEVWRFLKNFRPVGRAAEESTASKSKS
jgi:hypothetical protein